jgi:hypothetical protein
MDAHGNVEACGFGPDRLDLRVIEQPPSYLFRMQGDAHKGEFIDHPADFFDGHGNIVEGNHGDAFEASRVLTAEVG